MAFLTGLSCMARTQILVHRWGPRTKISALFSLRSMAVLSSRAHERPSHEIHARSARERATKPPQCPRGFSALARLYYLARPTKTAMLRRLGAVLQSDITRVKVARLDFLGAPPKFEH